MSYELPATPNRRQKFKGRALAILLLVASLALLAVGIPRFLHELMLVPGTPIYERLSAQAQVSDEELTLLEQSRLAALGFANLPKAHMGLGASYLARAYQATNEMDRLHYAQLAIVELMTGLREAPLDTFAWLRLTAARNLLGPEHYSEALEAWRASIEIARFEPNLLIIRVHFGIILYSSMSDKEIVLLHSQFNLAYETYRTDLWQYSRKNNLREWMIFLSDGDAEKIAFLSRK